MSEQRNVECAPPTVDHLRELGAGVNANAAVQALGVAICHLLNIKPATFDAFRRRCAQPNALLQELCVLNKSTQLPMNFVWQIGLVNIDELRRVSSAAASVAAWALALKRANEPTSPARLARTPSLERSPSGQQDSHATRATEAPNMSPEAASSVAEFTFDANCEFCRQFRCCPVHCCDWDECACGDCDQCGGALPVELKAHEMPQHRARKAAAADNSPSREIASPITRAAATSSPPLPVHSIPNAGIAAVSATAAAYAAASVTPMLVRASAGASPALSPRTAATVALVIACDSDSDVRSNDGNAFAEYRNGSLARTAFASTVAASASSSDDEGESRIFPSPQHVAAFASELNLASPAAIIAHTLHTDLHQLASPSSPPAASLFASAPPFAMPPSSSSARHAALPFSASTSAAAEATATVARSLDSPTPFDASSSSSLAAAAAEDAARAHAIGAVDSASTSSAPSPDAAIASASSSTRLVKLASSDGREFLVPVRVASVSSTLASMLLPSHNFRETESIVNLG